MGSAPNTVKHPPRPSNGRPPRRNGKRRRLTKKERLRRKRIRRLKRFTGALLVIIVIVLIIVKVNQGSTTETSAEATTATTEDVSSSTAVFSKNGQIKVTSVESFDKDYYSEDELSSMIDTDVQEANDAGCSIKNNGLSVKNGVATLTLTYGAWSDYVTFNDRKLYYGAVSEAADNGYDPEEAVGCTDLSETDLLLTSEDLADLQDNTYVYVTDEMTLSVPYDILYASANLMVDGRTATPCSTVSEESPAMLVLEK